MDYCMVLILGMDYCTSNYSAKVQSIYDWPYLLRHCHLPWLILFMDYGHLKTQNSGTPKNKMHRLLSFASRPGKTCLHRFGVAIYPANGVYRDIVQSIYLSICCIYIYILIYNQPQLFDKCQGCIIGKTNNYVVHGFTMCLKQITI